MRAILTSFGIQRALFLALLLALALAPAVEAAHHGPAALVAEAELVRDQRFAHGGARYAELLRRSPHSAA